MTYKLKSNIRLFLITGPGHHAQMLINASRSLSEDIYYTTYWPNFAHYKKSADGPVVLVHKSFWFNLWNNLLWSIAARFKFLKKVNKHLDWSYGLYDLYVKSRYQNEEVLWAWGQMSLSTIQKAKKAKSKVVLEYPMIHCREWDHIMNAALGPKYPYAYSYFSKSMLVKIEKEYSLADRINVLSSYAKQTFLRNGVQNEKVSLSHLYVDPEIFQPMHIGKDSSEPLKILFVGRVDILKGILSLVEALQRIDFEYELHLAGYVYDEVLESLAVIAKHTVKHGVVGKEGLAKLYNQCDVLVLPSLQESFGLVILEALSCGLPVIASKNTGAPDVLSHCINGYVFDPEKVSELVNGLVFFQKAIKLENSNFSSACRDAALLFSSQEKYTVEIKEILNDV